MPNRTPTHAPRNTTPPPDSLAPRRFRSSAAWQSLRDRFLQGTPLCELCGAVATDAHHRKHVATHWDLRMAEYNLVALCFECHQKVHSSRTVETAMRTNQGETR